MLDLLSFQRRLLIAFDIVAPHNARVLCACIQSFNSKHADGSVADLENVLFILSGGIQGLHRCMKGRGHVRLRRTGISRTTGRCTAIRRSQSTGNECHHRLLHVDDARVFPRPACHDRQQSNCGTAKHSKIVDEAEITLMTKYQKNFSIFVVRIVHR